MSIELSEFRQTFRRWVHAEIVPPYAQWEADGCVPREIWHRAGELGFLCPGVPSEFGGLGLDYRYSRVVIEELAYACVTAPFFQSHSDITARSILQLGTPEQKQRWLPAMVAGRVIGANATTEPNAGSDLQSIQTRGRRDGAGWVLAGQKTLISLGSLCDLVLVLARTADADTPAMRAFTMFIVPTSVPGFSRGKPLRKIGMRALDNVEMFFDDCRLEDDAVLGSVGAGLTIAMLQSLDDRLGIGVECVASARAAMQLAVVFAHDRQVGGKPLVHLQDVRFKIAEMAADVAAGEALVDAVVDKHLRGKLQQEDAALLKYWTSEMGGRVADIALGLHGGYGCMEEFAISRLYTDARIRRIYGGTNEIMKEIVSRRYIRGKVS